MRQCKIYYCRVRHGHVCCADCDDLRCDGRCLNGPERCGVCRVVPSRKKPVDVKRAMELRKAGLTYDAIGARLGCSGNTVRNLLRSQQEVEP